MTVSNATGTPAGQATAPRRIPAPGEPPVEAPKPASDSVAIQAAGADAPKARVFDAQVQFATGAATPGTAGQPALDQTLEAVVATFKTLSPEQQKALLADPNFVIEISGHASNLGSDKNYDNLGLSRKRARNTGEYVKAYLEQRGIEVPADRIKTTGAGNPGKAKAPDDDDPADRTARVRISLPGLSPLPPAPPVSAAPPASAPPPASEPSPAEAALAQFNETTGPLDAELAKGHAAETTLADREATVAKAKGRLEAARALLPELPAVSRPGAHALVNGLQAQLDKLAERATKERDAFTKAQAQLKAETEELAKAEAAKNKKGLRELAIKLLDAYRKPEAMAAELPPDARKELVKQAGDLKRATYEALARHSDDSKVDLPDNSYMFGRPGPKFKKAWEALKGLLAAGGPPTADQRTKAINDLKDMGDAVKDFDDPLVKEAAQAIYDELSQKVASKLSS